MRPAAKLTQWVFRNYSGSVIAEVAEVALPSVANLHDRVLAILQVQRWQGL
jgi:hypothetical protein